MKPCQCGHDYRRHDALSSRCLDCKPCIVFELAEPAPVVHRIYYGAELKALLR